MIKKQSAFFKIAYYHATAFIKFTIKFPVTGSRDTGNVQDDELTEHITLRCPIVKAYSWTVSPLFQESQRLFLLIL